MPDLILGPALRYVSETEATLWVETDAPCEVSVLDHSAPTFTVAGHHYALVIVRGLTPGTAHPYSVRLDGELVWPLPGDDFPVCAIRTLPGDGAPMRLAFGSCRVSLPHHEPYTLSKDEDSRGREIDALYALTLRMRREAPERWPHAMLWLGDQVYADEVSPRTRAFIASRRGHDTAPRNEVADFEEYTRLYRESWSDPAIRWFLSTVSNSMIWDDHDVHDDWNTSEAWLREMRAKPWWDARITGAIMSYWVYQHLGNASPDHLEDDEVFGEARQGGDITRGLRAFALRADRETAGTRWSYCRDFGDTRLIVVDSRGGRVLDEDNREMLDEEEWEWLSEHARGEFSHLLLATTLPWLLSPAMHHLEAWNEAVCDGAWGGRAARVGERIRQGLDLEHWGAFDASFDRLADLTREIGAGEHGSPPPAAIVALSGDVHHAYLADVAYPRDAGVRSQVWQAVCSPVRNPLDSRERRVIRAAMTRTAEAAGRLLARSAGVEDPEIRWRVCDGPWFDNQIATLDVEGRSLRLEIERAQPGDTEEDRRLETVLSRRLA
ncbi:MAG TPA: alkaline phosphatase D family protein [Solirubrobacteraceae bacterium]|nr:alkaline phosphatase D family protein [Solirubrobacteraceae bacterium]